MREINQHKEPSLNGEYLGLSERDGTILRNRALMIEKYQIDSRIPLICEAPYQQGEFRHSFLPEDTFLIPLLGWNDTSTGKVTYGYLVTCTCDNGEIKIKNAVSLLAGFKKLELLGETPALYHPSNAVFFCFNQESKILCLENGHTILVQTKKESQENPTDWQSFRAEWRASVESRYNSGPLRYRKETSVDVLNSNGESLYTLSVSQLAGTFGNGYSASLTGVDGNGQLLTCSRFINQDPFNSHTRFKKELLSTETFS
jgi:hypothetical protein